MFGRKFEEVNRELKEVQEQADKTRPAFDHTQGIVIPPQQVQQARDTSFRQMEQEERVKEPEIKKETIKPQVVQESNQAKLMQASFNEGNQVNKNMKHESGVVPPFLSREIQLFKIFSFSTIIITLFLMIYVSVEHLKPALENDNVILLVPIALIVGFSFYKFLVAIIGLREIGRDQKQVVAESKTGITTVPMFLLKVYRKLKVRITNMNWIAFTTYIVFGGLLLIYQQVVNNNVVVKFPFTEWKLIDAEHIGTDAQWIKSRNFMAFTLIAVVAAHIITLINTRLRTGAIDSFYGYEIISNQEVELLKRHANIRNRRILIISLLCIFLLIWVPYKIIKRRGK